MEPLWLNRATSESEEGSLSSSESSFLMRGHWGEGSTGELEEQDGDVFPGGRMTLL